MHRYSLTSFIIIWASIFCACLLQIMPLPPMIDAFRPNWMLLVGLYWSLALPHRFNLGSAWICGFLLDLLWGTTLGINALAFVIVQTMAVINFQKIRNFSIWQQALVMASASLLYQFLSYLFESLLNGVLIPDGYYLSSLMALFAWPWLFFLLRKTRRVWRIT